MKLQRKIVIIIWSSLLIPVITFEFGIKQRKSNDNARNYITFRCFNNDKYRYIHGLATKIIVLDDDFVAKLCKAAKTAPHWECIDSIKNIFSTISSVN